MAAAWEVRFPQTGSRLGLNTTQEKCKQTLSERVCRRVSVEGVVSCHRDAKEMATGVPRPWLLT